ncbi:hypothetical protein [Anaeromyxobacter dehalogenans]|uniref:Uncharacterized protein n=1 Tax=Anaeromyxobacter dehalogenans (strain 2CP-C) TaxID=290397 RepID=Q2IME1_ANADE|nr:hypothetical protein [Anaeromyxobacter dehalogenans]ABC79974.1 hypothetical protein Adeh_0197 [Anaeromyxobacter dehalogenans 2CP-C]
MDAQERDRLAGEVDALAAGLEEARGRHAAGLDPEPSLAPRFAARSEAAHRRTVDALRAAGEEALAARVAALRAERAAAGHEEAWRAAEAAARGRGPDGEAPLAALELAALRERDRGRRLALARAAAEALEPAAAHREAACEAAARARAEVGHAPDWRVVVEGDQLLAASDDAWRDVLAYRARTALEPLPAGDLARADLLHLLALGRWDGLFRAGMLPVALKLTLEPLGLDGRARVDAADRPAQWPGVHVHGARISFRPRGGAGDWQDLVEGMGRALGAAAAPPHRRDPALGAALGWLLGSLLLEPRWLADRAGVERRQAADVVRDLALRRLLALRARAAALRVATEVERGLSGARWREAYVEAMEAATGARWEGVRAARDADAAAHAAALRGADAGERLRRDLRERLDEDWWRNPRAAPLLAGLLAAGALPPEPGDTAPAPGDAARALVARLEGKPA